MGNKQQHGYHTPPSKFLREYRKSRKQVMERKPSAASISTTAWKKGIINKDNVSRYLLENPDYLNDFVMNYTSTYRIREWLKCLPEYTEINAKRQQDGDERQEFDRYLQHMYVLIPLFLAPKQPLLSQVERLLTKNEYNDSNPPMDIESHLFPNSEISKDKINFVFMYMIEKLLGTTAFPKHQFAYFLAIVQANYFDQPYHNYNHAIGHAQSMYWILRNCLGMFTELETKILMIASICHDIGHPGFGEELVRCAVNNNVYDVPRLEQYHTQTTYSILFNENANIFSSLVEDDFIYVLRDLRMCILSTYFNEFPHRLENLKRLIKKSFDIEDSECRNAAKSILMMICDLSASWKSWKVHMSSTWAVYKEFYAQSEKMEKLGFATLPQFMRKNMAQMPGYQIAFLENLALPLFRETAKIFPFLSIAIEQVEDNKILWIQDLRILNYF